MTVSSGLDAALDDPAEPPTERSKFRSRLVTICMGGAIVRFTYLYILVVRQHAGVPGDALYYSAQGRAIAAGRGFAAPFYFVGTTPAADHPPLAAVIMSIAPFFADGDGNATWFRAGRYEVLQRVTMVLIGLATVALIGITARRAARGSVLERSADRIGLFAAGFAALSPNLWINDGLLMSETVAAFALALVIYAAVVAWQRNDARHWALLGASVGLAALARAESITLIALLVAPMVLMRLRHDVRRLLLSGLIAGVACVAVCSVWLVPNALRFKERALFSTNDGLTWLGANCDQTYNGEWRGTWTLGCLSTADSNHNGIDDWTDLSKWTPYTKVTEDQSQVSKRYQTEAFKFISNHKRQLPGLMTIRVLRTWGMWRPDQMVEYNKGEGRDSRASWAAWAFHIALLPLAAAGVIAMRKAKLPAWPYVAQAAAVTLTSAIIYGLARFRLGWDVAVCVLAAYGLNYLLSLVKGRSSDAAV